MSTEHTLVEILEGSGAEVTVYDMGRRIGALTRETFLAFERARQPYPLPMQRKAWLAVVRQTGDANAEPLIWFLRLELDEQGLLVQAGRDYLLSRLLESARASVAGSDPQAFLQDNPHAFTPSEPRMALLHARLSADLARPPSRFYTHAYDYFLGRPGWDQWGFVGYQGIADMACRHDDVPLTAAIAELPVEPLQALCHCLESQIPSAPLVDALLARLRRALEEPDDDPDAIAALIRALSRRAESQPVLEHLEELLAHPRGGHIEVLAALSGRAWEALGHASLMNTYLRRLAAGDAGHGGFAACVSDLLSLPALTAKVRIALRDPAQDETVRVAFGRMLSRN